MAFVLFCFIFILFCFGQEGSINSEVRCHRGGHTHTHYITTTTKQRPKSFESEPQNAPLQVLDGVDLAEQRRVLPREGVLAPHLKFESTKGLNEKRGGKEGGG